jgi:ribulose-phosphate 3-epimerase
MVEIIPAILPKSFEDLEMRLVAIRGASRMVQIDIVDGVYAPSKTWPYADHSHFHEITSEDEGMPLWEEFDFEFDLMIEHPAREVEKFLRAEASAIVVHAKSRDALEAIQVLQPSRGGELGIRVGLALASHDTVEVLEGYEGLYDYVQVMGIDREGRQGEPPDPHRKELALILDLRAQHPDLFIQVDGATAAHPRELREAGASRLVVGGAIVNADNPSEALRALYNQANN